MITDFDQLYYKDSYLRSFESHITDARLILNEFWLRFDQTAFYPEGGGQPGDRGIISIPQLNLKLEVIDTKEDRSLIWHRCKGRSMSDLSAEALIGLQVRGEIDWDRRFDMMQQHSAEHILSGLVNRHFGYDNVGFHINETLMTIDFSGPLTDCEIADMEKRCNEAIRENIAYEIDYYTPEEAKSITYRSKIDLPDAIRIVTVPGYDRCACCGTQVRFSGELGLLKVIGSSNYKGGVRLEVLAGRRALEDYTRKHEAFIRLSRSLSSPVEQVENAVVKLAADEDDLKYKISKLEQRLVRSLLSAVTVGVSEATAYKHNDLSRSAHKELCKKVSEIAGSPAVVYGEMEDKSIAFCIIAEGKLDGHALMADLKNAFGAKGGGKPNFISGQIAACQTSTSELDLFFSKKGFMIKEL